MNSIKFSEAMSELDSKYVDEAVNYRKKAKKSAWIKWGALAACFAAAMFTAASVLPDYLNQQGSEQLYDPNNVITDDSTDDVLSGDSNREPTDDLIDNIPPAADEIHIDMNNIVINQISDLVGEDYARYNPETDEKVIWNKEDIIAYYGTDLVPAYIPNGLSAYTENSEATVYIGQDGSVAEDTVYLSFYNYLTNSAEGAVKQGFTVTASKIGIVNDCLYLLPENEVKTSDIGETEVIFGYRSMPYGPYDPETHEPSGYYDMYVAEFKLNDAEFKIVAEQMAAEEVVKVVSSIIYGEKVTVDK